MARGLNSGGPSHAPLYYIIIWRHCNYMLAYPSKSLFKILKQFLARFFLKTWKLFLFGIGRFKWFFYEDVQLLCLWLLLNIDYFCSRLWLIIVKYHAKNFKFIVKGVFKLIIARNKMWVAMHYRRVWFYSYIQIICPEHRNKINYYWFKFLRTLYGYKLKPKIFCVTKYYLI